MSIDDGVMERPGGLSRRNLTMASLIAAAAGIGTVTAPGPAAASPATGPRPRTPGGPGVSVLDYRVVDDIDTLRATAPVAPAEVIHLRGYTAGQVGLGAGELIWVAGSTAADDGGTVFAVAGDDSGRWHRPAVEALPLGWFGVDGRGIDDDSSRLQAAIDSLGVTGGKILLGPGVVRLEQTVQVVRAAVTFIGAGAGNNDTGDHFGTQIVVATGSDDALVLSGVRGGGMRDVQMRGEGLTGGTFVRTEREGTAGSYLVTFEHCRFRDGFNGVILRGSNTIRFANCVWSGFTGDQVILLNGVDNSSRADPVEFVQCAIAAGSGNDQTDNVVIDGQGGSIKFVEVAVLFGRHGIWMRNTTDEGLPKFLYFEGGGFENGDGVPVLLDAGSQAQFVNTYISADNLSDAVQINAGFGGGSAIFSGCLIRGTGRHGIDIGATRVTVTGCIIGNTGRGAHPSFGQPVTSAVAGSGGVEIVTAAAHGWQTQDRVTVSGSGAADLDGMWWVDVVDDVTLVLRGASVAGALATGAVVVRDGAGINIRESADRVVITGNVIGSLADGISRQDYGIVCASRGVTIADNDLDGNARGPYLLATDPGPRTRITGNNGLDQLDGWFTAHLAGAVANGSYGLDGALAVDGTRLLIRRVVARTGSGTCGVLLDGLDMEATSVTTDVVGHELSVPVLVDGLSEPVPLTLEVIDAMGVTDLRLQLGYQVVG